jgi:hypothetical protein
MPMIMQTIDEIMDAAKRDMYFIRFPHPFFTGCDKPNPKLRIEHLAWFDANGLPYVKAAPRGWLEGDPGCFAVYFSGIDDPRVAAYAAEFEDAEGKSLHPDDYQMFLVIYQSWLEAGGLPDRDVDDEES